MTPPPFGNPSGGEPIDRAARDSIKLAYEALDRFPELVRRHKFIAGGAAISSSLIVLAGVAIARRMLTGQTAEEAVASVTEDEVQGLRVVEIPSDEPTESAEDAEAETTTTDAPEALGEVDIEEAAGNGELETPASGASDVPASTTGEPSNITRMNGAS